MRRSATPCVLYIILIVPFIASPAAKAVAAQAAAGPRSAKQYAELKQCDWPRLDTAVQHFSEILQFHTVGNASHPNHADPVVWELLDLWMREAYSSVFDALEVETVMPWPLENVRNVPFK